MAKRSARKKRKASRRPASRGRDWSSWVEDHSKIDAGVLRRELLRGVNIDDLASKLGVPRQSAVDAIADVHAAGGNVIKIGKRYQVLRDPPPLPFDPARHELRSDNDNVHRFGVISDTHYCSKYARPEVVEDLYDWYAGLGITTVFHCGNWIDGEARFNRLDLLVHGMQAQLDYFVEEYPMREGIETRYVSGDDHEGWYAQREGVDIGRMLENTARDAGRSDLVHLGYKEAFVTLYPKYGRGTAKLLVDHPGGGTAYALSYAAQKRIEAAQPGEKPAVWLFGHWHKAGFFNDRGVNAILVPCTQDLTPWARKKGLSYHQGGLVVTLHQDAGGAIDLCVPEFRSYYNRGYYVQQFDLARSPERRRVPGRRTGRGTGVPAKAAKRRAAKATKKKKRTRRSGR